jgi:hypothetical protein
MSIRQDDPDVGSETAQAPIGRLEFVLSLVNEFERTNRGVDARVGDYMLDKVLWPEDRWLTGIERRQIDVPRVRAALIDALRQAAPHAESRGVLFVDVEAAHATFKPVLETDWECPYGLWFC